MLYSSSNDLTCLNQEKLARARFLTLKTKIEERSCSKVLGWI
jgi:hypothetical protein